jgi:hypothetical protein
VKVSTQPLSCLGANVPEQVLSTVAHEMCHRKSSSSSLLRFSGMLGDRQGIQESPWQGVQILVSQLSSVPELS